MKIKPVVETNVIAWHALDTAQTLQHLKADEAAGLSAATVAARQREYGFNILPEAPRRSLLNLIWSQFQSPLIYILFVAALFSLILGKQGDAVVILAVVLVNALIGVFQEGRAERSMAALQQLSSLHTQVLRDGVETVVAARELVPGDIIVLTAGDAVGADARLLKVAALEVAALFLLTGSDSPVNEASEIGRAHV